jgi:phospholipid/cholesterol/gamma-HCH transport system substrate-binding protein
VKRPAFVALSAAASLALTGCGFSGLYSAPLPGGADLGSHPFTVTIQFADVLDLVPQSAVKVDDVAVGKVSSISLQNCTDPKSGATVWCAKVKVKVNGSVSLPSNSTAEVEQTSLLGEKYVALIRPATKDSAATKLKDGALIPFARTSSAPEVEQVLGALSLLLNDGGLSQIKAIAQELDKALGTAQRQEATRDLIVQLNTFSGTLDKQKDQITNALDSIDKLAGTLNNQKKVLTDALDTYPAALSVLSQERTKLVTLLTSLSKLGVVANQVINSTQTDLVSSLKSLEPVLVQLTATGSSLPNSLKILGTFPFPLGATRTIIKGDYANLDATVDLNLTSELCGLLGIGCGTTKATTGATQSKPAPASVHASQLQPMLVGAGR